ncbi:MAG: pyridoxal phosphate-dependent aminotransferase [Candidatus Bathyarchaeota archaeon]
MSKEKIVLSIGDPDVEAPDYVFEAAYEKMKEGGAWTHYGYQSDKPAGFRSAVVDYYKKFGGVDYEPSAVIPSAGSSAALYIALRTILNEGDEILMFEPTYRGHFTLLNGMGVKQNLVQLEKENAYHPDIDAIAEAVTPKTKAVLVCNPNNPTGTVFTPSELKAIGDLAVDHDMGIYSDEIYLHFTYDDNVFTSTASLSDAYKERTINIMSFSKTFSMTGWRLGYIMVPEMYLAKAKMIAGMAAPRPPTFLYAAGEAALRGDFKYVNERCAAYDERRKYFCKATDAIEGLQCDLFEGSFYAWIDAKSTGMKSQEFVDKFAEVENVYFSPGHTFGPSQDGMLRVPLCQKMPVLEEGIARLERFIASL